MIKNTRFYLSGFLGVMLIGISLITYAYPGEVIKQISISNDFPTGLCYADGELVMADRKTDLIYFIQPETGKTLRTIPAPAYWPSGLTYDGNALWVTDVKGGIPLAENYRGVAYKINPENGEILHRIDVPCAKPVGMCFDGKYLWTVDDAQNQIIQLSPEDGTTISSFKAPAHHACGITFDGTYLWVSDRMNDELYMISPETGKVLLITDSPGKYACDLAWDGATLWNVDWNEKAIFQLVRQDDDLYRRTNEQTAEVKYTHQATNFGPGKVTSLDVHFAMGSNRDNQALISPIEWSEKPTDFPVDKWGQKTAHFHLDKMKAGDVHEVMMKAKIRTWDVRYFIFPDQVGGLDEIPTSVKETFLANHEKYQINHDVIANAVKEAVGDEKNPYWIARKIYHYLMPRMYYEMSGGWNTAPTVLARGNGSCSEYSFVYIAMCRAAGLPARYVGSVVSIHDPVSMDDVFHRWVEVYLPNYGWVPVDPSGGDSDNPRTQADYFGHIGNRYFITTQSGGGSESMGWTYNSNYLYQSEPKANLVVEYFADWRILD